MDLTNLNKDRKNKRQNIDMSSMVYGKIPPQARELEESLLGEIMTHKNAIDIAIEIITAESFYVDSHQRIFRAMLHLSQWSQPIDEMTVMEELRRMEELEFIGGPYYLTKLTGKVSGITKIEFSARVIQEMYLKRALISVCSESIGTAYEDGADAFEVMEQHEEQILKLNNSVNRGAVMDTADGLVKVIKRLEYLRTQDNHITGISSGYYNLDKITHGWQVTDLIILAARPSVGKTAFAMNLALNSARKGEPVLFFSLEMSAEQLLQRALSCESEIYMENILTGKLDDQQMKHIYSKGVTDLSRMPLHIDDTASLNIFELRAKCRRMLSKKKIKLIIIDYLQLMNGVSEKTNNREQEISKITRSLKGLAKDLNVPIIALSQLSRDVEKRKGDSQMPRLSDLRESGAIEQDADMVMFLYRPEYHGDDFDGHGESNSGKTFLKIAKHRNGTLATVNFIAKLHIQKFVEGEERVTVASVPPSGFRSIVKDDEELF